MAAPFPIGYINGAFMPLAQIRISPLDRGFLFGDAIYEVVPLHNDVPQLLDAHIARLDRSLGAIGAKNPYDAHRWADLITELGKRNGGGTLSIYIQVSRGVETGRDHVYSAATQPTVFAMATELPTTGYHEGVTAITRPDLRWQRCDIKSTSLLANILSRQQAADAGSVDAILIANGCVTEGSVSSVIIVEQDVLIRRPHGNAVLPGTTTDHVIEIATNAGYACREESITEARLMAADEVWLTGATKGIAPVVRIDDQPIGDGRPGPLWKTVNSLYEGLDAPATA